MRACHMYRLSAAQQNTQPCYTFQYTSQYTFRARAQAGCNQCEAVLLRPCAGTQITAGVTVKDSIHCLQPQNTGRVQ